MSRSRPSPGGLADCGLAEPAPASVCRDREGAIGRIGATGVVRGAEGIGLTAGIELMDGGWDRSWPTITAEPA